MSTVVFDRAESLVRVLKREAMALALDPISDDVEPFSILANSRADSRLARLSIAKIKSPLLRLEETWPHRSSFLQL